MISNVTAYTSIRLETFGQRLEMKRVGKLLTSLASAAALMLAGCAAKPPPFVVPPSLEPDIANRLGIIGIAPVKAPETDGLGPAGTKADAAERAGGNAAGGWAYGSVGAFGVHPAMGLAAVLLLPFAIVGAGVYGAIVGVSEKEAKLGAETLRLAVADIRPDETLRERVFVDASRETRHKFVSLNDPQGEIPVQDEIQSGAETILEITEATIALVPIEDSTDPKLTLVLSAHLGLRRAGSEEELYATDLKMREGAAGFREWVADDASLFRKALDEVLNTFAEKAVMDVFLRYSTHLPEKPTKSLHLFLVIQPVSPEHAKQFNKIFSSKSESVRPTLRWQAFPTPADIAADPSGGLARATNVTYDLKIWRQGNFDFWGDNNSPYFFPDRIIHDVEGKPGPYFVPPEPLEPFTSYFWTVRARFEIDGFPRLTDWMVVKGYTYNRGHFSCWNPYTIGRDPRPSCLVRFHTPAE